jgi:hypothetical protein
MVVHFPTGLAGFDIMAAARAKSDINPENTGASGHGLCLTFVPKQMGSAASQSVQHWTFDQDKNDPSRDRTDDEAEHDR